MEVEKEEVRFGNPIGFGADFLRFLHTTAAAAEGLFSSYSTIVLYCFLPTLSYSSSPIV